MGVTHKEGDTNNCDTNDGNTKDHHTNEGNTNDCNKVKVTQLIITK